MRTSGRTPRTIGLLCLVVWLLGACGGQPAPPVSHGNSPLTGPYTFTPSPARQPSGQVVLADSGFPTTLNPLFAATRFDLELRSALWAAPVVFDEHFHAQPDQLTEVPLPENGDVQDGGKTIIMHLRHNLRWSDGQPLLASDFAYWWRLDQNQDTGAITTTGYDQIARIETPNDFTVILHMKLPFGPYLSYLPYAAPEHAWGHIQAIDLQNHPDIFLAPTVTDGPYKLARFIDQQSYTLVPNPYYTSTVFHGPFLAQLTYRAYPTPEALALAIQHGQVDMAEGYTEDELPSLRQIPAGVQLREGSAAAYEHLDFNLARPFLQDRRVRQAIQLAIDRCGIIQDVLHMSNCARLLDQVEPQPSLVYDPNIHLSAYNPGAARSLLTEAGWLSGADDRIYKHGQPLVVRLVTTSGNALRAATARLLQKNLRAIGIQVDLAFYDLGTFFGVYPRGGILATGAYDLSMFGYANSADPDDEYMVFQSSQIPGEAQPDLGNYGRIHDPLIDQALMQGRFTVPFAARKQSYQSFLERLAQEIYVIPLYTALNILIVNLRLKNILGNPNAVENNWNIADWWISG